MAGWLFNSLSLSPRSFSKAILKNTVCFLFFGLTLTWVLGLFLMCVIVLIIYICICICCFLCLSFYLCNFYFYFILLFLLLIQQKVQQQQQQQQSHLHTRFIPTGCHLLPQNYCPLSGEWGWGRSNTEAHWVATLYCYVLLIYKKGDKFISNLAGRKSYTLSYFC